MMKRLLLGALFLLPADVLAQGTSIDQICATAGVIAETVMYQRQQNVPISTVMQRIEEGISDEDFRGLGRLFTELAYQEPAEHLEEDQKRAVANFRNTRELSCYQMMGDG
jgi:hypothetical protein